MGAEQERCPVFRRRRNGLLVPLLLAICSISCVPSAQLTVEAFTSPPPSSVVGRQQRRATSAGLDQFSGCRSLHRDSRSSRSPKLSLLLLPSPWTPRTTISGGSKRRATSNDRDGPKRVKIGLSPTELGRAKNGDDDDDAYFDLKTTGALVGGQSVLIGIAAVVGGLLGTPNYGLGPNVDFDGPAIREGILWTIPLGVVAYALDSVEGRFPALQDVSTATEQSVLRLLGGTFRPVFGLVVAATLGLAAGLGEEMFFRGVLQYELLDRFGSEALALGASSIIFGALHAVTPVYAILASMASVYFGWLYLLTDNLAVPIATHAFYDLVALFYAHYEVARMDDEEQWTLANWRPTDRTSDDDGTE